MEKGRIRWKNWVMRTAWRDVRSGLKNYGANEAKSAARPAVCLRWIVFVSTQAIRRTPPVYFAFPAPWRHIMQHETHIYHAEIWHVLQCEYQQRMSDLETVNHCWSFFLNITFTKLSVYRNGSQQATLSHCNSTFSTKIYSVSWGGQVLL